MGPWGECPESPEARGWVLGLGRENKGWMVNLLGNIKSKQIIGFLSAKEWDSDVGRIAV